MHFVFELGGCARRLRWRIWPIGGFRKWRRRGAEVGGEVAVAAAHGEAVGIANSGEGDDFAGEIEVGAHLPEDELLLEILLSQEKVGGLGDGQEFGDDGADAAKVAGADLAFEDIGERARVDRSAKC